MKVVFYTTTQPNWPKWLCEGITLHSPSFQTVGERLFVVGTTPVEDSWSSNRDCAIAWDSVIHYVVLPSDDYIRLVKVRDDETEEAERKQFRGPKTKQGKAALYLVGIGIPIAIIVALIAWTISLLSGS